MGFLIAIWTLLATYYEVLKKIKLFYPADYKLLLGSLTLNK